MCILWGTSEPDQGKWLAQSIINDCGVSWSDLTLLDGRCCNGKANGAGGSSPEKKSPLLERDVVDHLFPTPVLDDGDRTGV